MRPSGYTVRIGWNEIREQTYVFKRKVYMGLAATFIVGVALVVGVGLVRVRSQAVAETVTQEPVSIIEIITTGYYYSDPNQITIGR